VSAAEAERIAQQFHETYERLAPEHGYETREASAVSWEKVPEANKGLMVAVAADLLARGVVVAGGPDPFAQARAETGLEIDRG
jgi:hypothetical protein